MNMNILKSHRKSLASALAFTSAFIVGATGMSGCSTISFFPAAPAQKAADKVIDDIWPAQETAKAPPSPVATEGPNPASKSTGAPAK